MNSWDKLEKLCGKLKKIMNVWLKPETKNNSCNGGSVTNKTKTNDNGRNHNVMDAAWSDLECKTVFFLFYTVFFTGEKSIW